MILKARKKPVVIETILFDGTNQDEILDWVGGRNEDTGAYTEFESGRLLIQTFEGEMTASKGDYIIKGVQGEFYPCKPDIFEATYDIVETFTDVVNSITSDVNARIEAEK